MTQDKTTANFNIHKDCRLTGMSYETATGTIDYGMTNDYMFRAILQKNSFVLKGLVSSLLHLPSENIISIEILNPIILGEDIKSKEFVLDINILLNNNTRLNLEMQISNQFNWTDRSLSYLCRSFDQLFHSQDYTETKPIIHVSFLDFTPFPDNLEFYSTHKLLNVKNYQIYSDKIVLSVVNLKHIELATEEDKASQLDHWARFFKAKTWEEIKMIAKNNEYLSEASQTLYEMNADNTIREQCLYRQEREKREYLMKKRMQELTEENSHIARAIAHMEEENVRLSDEKKHVIEENARLTAEKEHAVEENARLTAEKEHAVEENARLTAEKEHAVEEISHLRALLAEHNINADN